MYRIKQTITILVSLVIIMGLWIALFLQLNYNRRITYDHAVTNASNLTKVIDAHLENAIDNLDEKIVELRSLYIRSPEKFDRLAHSIKQRSRLLKIIQVSVINSRGLLEYNSEEKSLKSMDLRDREHFIVHRDTDNDRLFISKPVFGRVSKKWCIQFTRKIIDSNGSFRGVLVLSVDPSSFPTLFKTIDVGSKGSIMLTGTDRVVRIRTIGNVESNDFTGRYLPPNRPPFDPKQAESGVYRVESSMFDGITRVIAYRRVQDKSLVIIVAMAESEIYGESGKTAKHLVLANLVVTACLLIGMFSILLFNKREELLNASVAANEKKFRNLFNSMQEGFALLEIINDQQGRAVNCRFLDINPAFERIVEKEREGIIDRTLLELYPGTDPCLMETFGQVANNGESKHLEHDFNDRGGYYEIFAYCPAKGQFALILNDITDRMQLQDELIRSQRLDSLGLLAGGIAHDFNNIMTGILGYLSIVQTTEESKPYIRECKDAVRRATALTKRLLTFSRGGEPHKITVSLKPLIEESINLSLLGTNCRGEVTTDEELWSVEADSGQMHQVFNNLLLNARQAMPDGGVITVTAKNTELSGKNPFLLPAGSYVSVSVRDRGTGIPKEIIGRIFDPFFTTKAKGTGIGLTTSYSIIKRHGGLLTVQSVPGQGTVFTCHLPASTASVSSGAIHSARLPGVVKKLNILVMDDEEVVRELSCRLLRSLSHSVESCSDGKEAIQLVDYSVKNGTPFDIVILDLTVPGGMGGKDAITRIRELHPSIKAVVSSGYSNDPVMSQFRRYGFDAILNKPFGLEMLSDAINGVAGAG